MLQTYPNLLHLSYVMRQSTLDNIILFYGYSAG